jgi:hypothetical protein
MEDLTPFLEEWRQSDSVAALRHLADMVRGFALDQTRFGGGWWDEVRTQSQYLREWLGDPATEAILEAAYFRYEREPFADEFATAADWLWWARR